MNKYILVFSSILLISLVSSLYPGESQVYPNTFGSDNLVWTIIENISELSVFPVVLTNTTNITIQIPSDFPPNSFKIVFLDNFTQKEIQTIVVSSGSSGGHSSSNTNTIIKYVNQTKEVEVPNYISVENKTIEYIQNGTIGAKYAELTKPKAWVVGIGILLVGIIIGLLFFIMKNLNTSEKEVEEYE